jgi:hypothetical protein
MAGLEKRKALQLSPTHKLFELASVHKSRTKQFNEPMLTPADPNTNDDEDTANNTVPAETTVPDRSRDSTRASSTSGAPLAASTSSDAAAGSISTSAATITSDTGGTSTSSTHGDATMAQVLSAIETLTSVFGFDVEVANEAIEAVGTDVTVCYNYILDTGMGKDQGGPIYPISTCPHIQDHVTLTCAQLSDDPHLLPCSFDKAVNGACPASSTAGRAKLDTSGEDGSCPGGENWLCLECGVVRCSRYVNGHAVSHWEETKTYSDCDGHGVAVSLADLSSWCHVCSAYVKNETVLDPLLRRLEELKFPNETTT